MSGRVIMASVIIWVLCVSLSGCARPAANPGQALPSQQSPSQVAELEAKVAALSADVDLYRNRVTELEQVSQANRDAYKQALQSPGYEAALRLVYQHLQQGDTSLLQELLPHDQLIEGGIHDKHQRTYRQYAPGESIDLQQFVAWGQNRPLKAGKVSVVATMPGYAWAVIAFPDGTHFRIMFAGWTVTHILATDEPMLLS